MKTISILKLKEYAVDHTIKECAEHFGYSVPSIYKFAHNFGITAISKGARGRPASINVAERNKVMIEYYNENHPSLRQLGEKFGLTKESARLILKQNNVQNFNNKIRKEIVDFAKENKFCFSDKKKLSEICEKYKVSETRVYGILYNEGLLTSETIKDRLKDVDAENKTSKELYEYCKDMCSSLKSFRNLLFYYKINFKKERRRKAK